MLLRFSVANHLSMRGKQELSLVASSLKDRERGLIRCDSLRNRNVLPAAVIYGANASGKSNVVSSIEFMKRAVLQSHRFGEPGGKIPRIPFALDPACANAPSVYDIDFVLDGVRYHYGFEASDTVFVSEWLYAFPKGYRQSYFERRNGEFTFGRGLTGRLKVIEDLTRPNSLFLSAAAQNSHEQLSKIFGYFRAIGIDQEITVHGGRASLFLAGKELDHRVIEFLSTISTGVVDYRIQEIEQSEEVKEFNRELWTVLEKLLNGPVDNKPGTEDRIVKIELAHEGRDGERIYFDLDRESAGTRRLLVVLAQAFRALDEGAPFVIDELDASLHTLACEQLLRLFCRPETNPNGAQLIATTHDTNLMHSTILRRDQIWLTEKDQEGATHLYPLTDIRTRRGDNIEKGYLEGRYGAIPFGIPFSENVPAQ